MDHFKSFMAKASSNKLLLFLFFWISTGIIYLPTYKSGFIAEFLGMFSDIPRVTFFDFINRSEADVKSFYQLTQLQLFVLIKVFGTRFTPWFILITVLHALNGLLIFTFFKNLFRDFYVRNDVMIALAGSLLFLFNPNITEVTVWKGGYHYLTGMMMQMAILLWTQRFLHTTKRKYLLLSFIMFLLSIFTLEIFYLTPILVFSLIYGYRKKEIIERNMYVIALRNILLPEVILFVIHLIMFKLVYGSWIAHYGVSSTFTTSVPEMLPRVGKYLSYILLMAGQLPENIRLSAYNWMGYPVVSCGLSLAVLVSTGWLVINFKKLSASLQVVTYLLVGMAFSLILVIPIYFDDLFSVYNSRRCYQPGVFVYMLLALILFSFIKNFRTSVLVFSCYFLICIAFTIRKAIHWHTAAQVQYSLLKSLPVRSTDTVLLLNVPCYYKDIRTVAANDDNEFQQQQKIFGLQSMYRKVYSVSSYNMQYVWNGAHVAVIDSSHIKVTLNQWGTWWMYNYTGATSFENELYKLEMKDPGHEYHLHLKKASPNIAILYQQGLHWKKLDMSLSGEQW